MWYYEKLRIIYLRTEVTLTKEEICVLLRRRALDSKNREKLLKWAMSSSINFEFGDSLSIPIDLWADPRSAPDDTINCKASFFRKGERAVAFWYAEEEDLTLPDQVRIGLETASIIAGFDVVLYTYQDLKSVPSSVSVLPASDLLPLNKFLTLKSLGVKVAVLADYIRVCAMMPSVSAASGLLTSIAFIWFIDCDTTWLRSPAAFIQSMHPESCGHVFASMRASNSCIAGKIAHEKNWLTNFLKEPRDKLFIATPFRVLACSPLLSELKVVLDSKFVSLLDAHASGMSTPAFPYTFFMDALRKSVIDLGLLEAITLHTVFSPIPAFTQTKSIRHTTSMHFDADDIIKSSVAVNCFWSSSKNLGEEGMISKCSHNRVERGSVWDSILRFAFSQMPGRLRVVTDGLHHAKRMRYTAKKPDHKLCIPAPMEWPPAIWSFPRNGALSDLGLASGSSSSSSTQPLRSLFDAVGEDVFVNEVFKQFQLVRKIGKGSYGVVYEGKRFGREDKVAVKIIVSDSPSTPVRSLELYLLSAARSNAIVSVVALFVSPSYSVIVMEQLTTSVSQLLKDYSDIVLVPEFADKVALDISHGLAYLHSHKVVYCFLVFLTFS
jgi:hypothetical protein